MREPVVYSFQGIMFVASPGITRTPELLAFQHMEEGSVVKDLILSFALFGLLPHRTSAAGHGSIQASLADLSVFVKSVHDSCSSISVCQLQKLITDTEA